MKTKKIIATAAVLGMILATAPAALAKDSVRKWGYWEQMTTPAAGPVPDFIADLSYLDFQDEDKYREDPRPIPPEPIPDPEPEPEPEPEKPMYYFYTTIFGSKIQPEAACPLTPCCFKKGYLLPILKKYGEGIQDLKITELKDQYGDGTGLYKVNWKYQDDTLDIGGTAVVGQLTPIEFLQGPARDLPVVADIKALNDMGDLEALGNIQALYSGFTMDSHMDVTIGVDFNDATFSAVFGEHRYDGFAANGVVNGQHFNSTDLSGINKTIAISGKVEGSFMNPEATELAGGIDVLKTVHPCGECEFDIHQVEAYAASRK